MEFQEVLEKKHAEIPGSSKNEVDFLGVIKKKSFRFSKGCSTILWNLLR